MQTEDVFCSLLLTGKTSNVAAVCAEVCKRLSLEQTRVDSAHMLTEICARQVLDLILLDADCLAADELSGLMQSLRQTVTPVLLLINGKDIEKVDVTLFDGVRDFCCNPLTPSILQAKISSMLKMRQILVHQQENIDWFAQHRANVEQERAVACNLFNSILRSGFLETSVVKSVISPNSLCIGDMLLVSRTPNDYLHLLVGDFSGRGISTSITAAPVAEVFYGMTAKGFDLEEIACEINQKLVKILTSELFLAAALVALQPDNKALHVINCGLPALFLIDRAISGLQTLPSNNLPLGIEYVSDLQSQTLEISANHYLYLYTDAVIELENKAGEPFGTDRLKTCLCQEKASAFDYLKNSLYQHSTDEIALQNMTYVELYCDIESIPWQSASNSVVKQSVEALPWKAMMEFDIKALRRLNPVPMMLNLLREVQGLEEHQQNIFLIVTELFANALDHGVLQLDSAIKASPEGFIRFYELKEKRLEVLDAGFVRVFFDHKPTVSGGQLIIKVRDSGKGFDFAEVECSLSSNLAYSGRGLSLLRSLCSQLTYHGQGNQVTAIYNWNR
jgi:two-component system, HptB-dependent secretion and biofilm response regulator